MADFRIRTFDAQDEPVVAELWQSTFPNDPPWYAPALVIQRKLRTQPELFLVGEFAGDIVATVLAGYDGVRGWIYHLAIAPKYQKKGFGRAMMEAAEERLRKMGCQKINLQVRSGNAKVIEFYNRIGYQIEDRVSFGKRLE
jgi:ribosomal protein S18 acetylase RimI-like enzyme